MNSQPLLFLRVMRGGAGVTPEPLRYQQIRQQRESAGASRRDCAGIEIDCATKNAETANRMRARINICGSWYKSTGEFLQLLIQQVPNLSDMFFGRADVPDGKTQGELVIKFGMRQECFPG